MPTKKLPRRVKSMANRAVSTAEAAADLDMLGGDDAANKPRVSVSAQATAFIAVMAAIIAGIMIIRLVASIPVGSNGDAPFGIDGALTRITPTPAPVLSLGSNSGISTLESVPRSPFPIADQEVPVIVAVTCPDGTVQIATGDRVADTVCIRGMLISDGVTAPTVEPTPTVELTPTPTARVTTLPKAGAFDPRVNDKYCADDSPANYTWQGSIEDGFACVPMSESTGLTSEIVVSATDTRRGGVVAAHTVPCHAHDTVLPPPFANVTLCVNAVEWAAAH